MTDDLSWASGEDPTLAGRTPDGCRIVVVRRTWFLGVTYWTNVRETKPGSCKPMTYSSNRYASKKKALVGARKQQEHEEILQGLFKKDS